MLENTMPGEALVPNGVPAEHIKAASQNALPNKTLQDMAEKLEKSEAGRKKLRQAISMLKEKVEANEKVLQVNEILRQECEKERLRADAERNRAEEEKKLREEVEKDGASMQEQLVRVLQRLDAVERNCKSDRSEMERMRKEMKQATSGLGGAVKAVEAAHSSFEGLEKNLLSQVSNAVCASTKSKSLAETGINDAKGAQGTALAAEKLSQSLLSKVEALQKQGSSLDQRVTLIQQELLTKQSKPSDNERIPNGNRAPAGPPLVSENLPIPRLVLSKHQQASTFLNSSRTANKDCVPEGTDPGPKRIRTAKPAKLTGIETIRESHAKDMALRSVCSAPLDSRTVGVPVHRMGALDKSRPESSKGSSVREALEAAKQKRNLLRTASTSEVIPQPGKSSACQRSIGGALPSDVVHAAKDRPVDGGEFRVRVQVDSGNGLMPALAQDEGNDLISSCVDYIPAAVSAPIGAEDNDRSNTEGRRTGMANNLSRKLDETCPDSKLVIANPSLSGKGKKLSIPITGTRIGKSGRHREKLPVALLKEITKLFFKEKKSHAKVERKLADLQRVLQVNDEDEAAEQGSFDTTRIKSRKRKRGVEGLNDVGTKVARVQGRVKAPNSMAKGDHVVQNSGHPVEENVSHGAVEKRASKWQRDPVATGEEPVRLLQPPANKNHLSGPKGSGKDFSEAGLKYVQNTQGLDSPQLPAVEEGCLLDSSAYPVFDSSTAGAPEAPAQSQEMDVIVDVDMCKDLKHAIANGSNGSDSDVEGLFDAMELHDRWTETHELLSPYLPSMPPTAESAEEPDTNSPSPWLENLDDVSHFLDALPTINENECERILNEDVCGQERTVVALPDVEDSKLRSAASSGVTASIGECNEGVQAELATETLSNLHLTKEMSNGNKSVVCVGSGANTSEKLDACAEDEKKERQSDGRPICGSSLSFGSPLESSLLPQDVIREFHGKSEASEHRESQGKSEAVEHKATVDSGACTDSTRRDAQGAVKEEKTDAVNQREILIPYSLELVLAGSTYESGVHASGSVMQQQVPLTSTAKITDEITLAFERSRKILLGGLSQTDGATGSSQSVTANVTSFFANSTLSKVDLMCIFTASVVDAHASWYNEKAASCLLSECEFLQLLIDVVKQVLATDVFKGSLSPRQAVSPFAIHLQKFLIHGNIQPESSAASQEALPPPEGRAVGPGYHFVTGGLKQKRLRALIGAAKLLAVYCESTGERGFLRNSVYRVLRFSDMESQYLLATVSSIACTGNKSLFAVDEEDVVGQAVQVVISELIRDVQTGEGTEASSANKEETAPAEIQQVALMGEVEVNAESSEWQQNLKTLIDAIGEAGGLSFESFVPRVVNLFHGMITGPAGSFVNDDRHLFQRCLRTITCGNAPAPQNGEKECDRSAVEAYCWRDVRSKSSVECVNQSEIDDSLVEDWEQKFYDITNSLELVASHLGWEWTYNDFFVEHLWKLVAPGAPAMTVACVAHMFGLLGRLGREVDSTELPGVDELRKSLLVILNSDQTSSAPSEGSLPAFSFRAQVAAAQALLVLSSFNRKDEIIPTLDPEKISAKSSELHAKSVKSLWNWVKARKPEIQGVLPSTVRSALLSIDESNFVPIF